MKAVTFHAERFLTGQKSALLAIAGSGDRCQLTPGMDWLPRDLAFEHGRSVYQVEHGQRYTSKAGQVFPVRSLNSEQPIEVIVTEIRMVEFGRLTDGEIGALGYTRDEFAEIYSHVSPTAKAWLVYALPAARSAMH